MAFNWSGSILPQVSEIQFILNIKKVFKSESQICEPVWFISWVSLFLYLSIMLQMKTLSCTMKGTLDKYNIIPQLFPKKLGFFIPLEVFAWVMTACWVLCSRLIYFWRNMNISSILFFSKSTSINTQYSNLWVTLKMMLFTKYPIKWKRIGRIGWKFRYWFSS